MSEPVAVVFFKLTVVEHKHDCRDAQKVEQVHRDGNAYDIGNQHQIAVGMWLVGTVSHFRMSQNTSAVQNDENA